ncbi:MAG TPA: PEP/pyruvate-binding domain-containing protein [Microlunatus sp.]|nr:PEP/pyruvate-binding domain-containing protein [Microlunatus sp.]
MTVSVHTGYIHPLSEPGGEVSVLGGKGESLVRLTEAGFDVPDGFCLTTDAYGAFVAANGLGNVIAQLIGRLDPADTAAVQRVSGIITTAFEAGDLPSSVVNQVRDGYAALGYGRVAVRSSATAEDLPTGSFAGQQESFLDVGDTASLVDAIRRCWASAWSPRALVYRARQGFAADVAVAVVVQRMVNAQASGVMFTVDPVTGLDSAITINAAWGLGEAVVGGDVTPDTFVVDRRTGRVTKQRTATKTVMTVRSAGGTALAPVPEHLRHRPSLTKVQALRLARLGRRIEALFQQPVDVEWCVQGVDLYILQARPVTTGRRADPWNDSYRGDFLWTNTNVGEAIPDVMTPASWSMIQVFLSDAMATASIPPYVGYGRIGGHIYLNVSVMKTLSGIVGVNERQFRALTEEVFGHLPDDIEIPPVPASWAKVMRSVVPVALHVLSEARRDVRDLDTYLAAHPALCVQRRQEVAEVDDPGELARLWTATLEPEFHKASLMLSAATRSSGASFVTTRKRLLEKVGPAGANAVTAGLGGDTGQLASMDLLRGLAQLDAGQIDEATFNERYGHRGPHEFEISLPRSGEDPAWLAAQRAQRSPETAAELADRQQKQAQVRELAWIRLGHRYPLQAWLLRRQVASWGKIARNRELARSEVIRYFWVLRSFAVRAGELTGLGDDIFFLDLSEILEALGGDVLDADEIAHRRADHERYTSLPPLPGLIRGRFDPFAWAEDSTNRVDPRSGVSPPSTPSSDAVVITGFPGSAGIVEGTARVILAASDGDRLRPGEILVTNVTNVGWTPLFPRAAAVITNVGAPLSHAAIVARELGIPAVVGCGNATELIGDGDRVRVDGSAGRITVLRS